jgi:hypothetical protein
LNQTNETAETYKEKYERLKEQARGEDYMSQARSFASKMQDGEEIHDISSLYGSVKSAATGKAGSVASLGSGLAQHAKTIVNSMNNFNCAALNERTGPLVASELDDVEIEVDSSKRRSRSRTSKGYDKSPQKYSGDRLRSTSRTKPSSTSRSFREYSRSPQRMDV